MFRVQCYLVLKLALVYLLFVNEFQLEGLYSNYMYYLITVRACEDFVLHDCRADLALDYG